MTTNKNLIEKVVNDINLTIPELDSYIKKLNNLLDLITTEEEKGINEAKASFLVNQLEELEVVRNNIQCKIDEKIKSII